MKANNRLETKDAYIRRILRSSPLPGRNITLLGGLMILLYAAAEMYIRYDAADGILQAYFNLVRNGDITFVKAITNLFNTEEFRHDLVVYLSLAASALTGLAMCVTYRLRRASYVFMPLSIVIALFAAEGSGLFALINVYDYIKTAGCCLVLSGSFTKLVSYHAIKRKAGKSYDKLRESRRRSTLIPPRIHEKRK